MVQASTTTRLVLALCLSLCAWLGAAGSAGSQEAGYVGVELQNLTEGAAREQGLADARGARVVVLRAGAPAALAGLQAGDIVTAIDGRPVQNTGELVAAIQRSSPGSIIRLATVRGGKPGEVAVKVGRLPDDIALTRRIDALVADKKHRQAMPLALQLVEAQKKRVGEAHADYAVALTTLAGLHESVRENADAERLYRRARAVREAAHGPEHTEVALSLRRLGRALENLQRHADAEASFRRALVIGEKLLGPEHLEVSTDLIDIGDALKAQGRSEDAEPLYRRAVAIREKAHGPEHLDVALGLRRLGRTLENLRRYADAESSYRRVLAIDEKLRGPEHPEVATDLVDIGDALKGLGRPADAEPLYRRALVLREKQWGRDHINVAWTMDRLASALRDMRRFEDAEPLYRTIVALNEKANGAEHADTAMAVAELGFMLERAGRLKDVEPHYRRALAIREKVLSADDPNLAWSVRSVGYVLEQTQRWGEAEPYYRRSLAIRERSRGPDHPQVADACRDLGDVLYSLGRYTEAEPLFRRALAIRERQAGGVTADAGWTHNRLGNTYERLGRYQLAEQHHRRMVAIFEQVSGAEHVDVSTGLGNLAMDLNRQGRYPESEALLRRGLAILEKSNGPDDPSLGWTLVELAYVLRRLARYEEAEVMARRALAIRERALGADALPTADSMRELANVLERLSRYEESVRLHRAGLAIVERVYGPEHRAVADFADDLALALRGRGHLAEGEALVRRALAIYEKVLGPEVNEFARVLHSLAYQLQGQDRYAEAEPLHRRALAIREKVFGPDDPETAWSLHSLGYNLYYQSKYAEAEPLHRRTMAIRQKAFGPDHQDLAFSYSNLADIMRYTNRPAEGEGLARRALEVMEKTLGPDNASVASQLNTLGLILEALDRSAEAEPLYRRALAIRQQALGKDHPDVAWNHNRLGLLAENGKRWQEALEHYRIATKSVAERAIETARTHRTLDDEVSRTRYVFRNLVDAAHGLSEEQPHLNDALMDEAFRAAQWRERTETSAAMVQMAARFGSGDSALAALVREAQDLRMRWGELERRLVQASGMEGPQPAGAAANVRTEFEAIGRRLDEIGAQVARQYPKYAELANPQPLTIAATQAILRGDEVLAFYLHTGNDTYVWAIAKDAAEWHKLGLGSKYLGESIETLRCGLDARAWDYPEAAVGDSDGDLARKAAQRVRAERCLAALKAAPRKQQLDGREVDVLPFDLAVAHELYNDLLAPIDGLIEGKRLLVVPSGPLTSLPFHLLLTDAAADRLPEETAGYRQAAWLAKKTALAVMPSISSLQALRQHAQPTRARSAFLGIGNPLLQGPDQRYAELAEQARLRQRCADVPKQRMQVAQRADAVDGSTLFRGGLANLDRVRRQVPLPGTAEELCTVAELMGVAESEIWLGARATEARIKDLNASGRLADYRILHFATHGVIAGEFSGLAEPALVLTPPDAVHEKDDGLLTASEVAQLKLDVDWVVMSACNTAAGSSHSAEALTGLARAFFYAGARALLVSHWHVYSDAAVKITTRAFAEMAGDDRIGRAEALRRSMVALIDTDPEGAHPAYWAPFVLVGEGAGR